MWLEKGTEKSGKGRAGAMESSGCGQQGPLATRFSMTAAGFWLWVWAKSRKKIPLWDHEVGCFDSSTWGYFSVFLAKATEA